MNDMINKTLIYALKDPETKEIRYIGKSTCGLRRPKQHALKYSLIANTHKNNWIKSLLAKNLMYEIEIIEENIDLNDLSTREIHWIIHYKNLSVNLTNGTDGGEGALGREVSEETRRLMGEKKKEWFQTNGPTETQLNTCFKRKERKTINGIEHKHCWKCNEYKQIEEFGQYLQSWDKISYCCKPCHNLIMAEYREKNAGPLLNPEELAKSYEDRKVAMSEGLKERYKNDPEYRLKNSRAKSKPILQCDLNGCIIKEFSSALEAKKAGFQNSNVGQAIKYKKPYLGFMWKFKNKE